MNDLSIMKDTLSVKDEELHNLSRDLRARESTIKEIAEKLTETAEAAEAAASAAHMMDEQRRLACAEIERLTSHSQQMETQHCEHGHIIEVRETCYSSQMNNRGLKRK